MPLRPRPAQLALRRVRGPLTPAVTLGRTQVRLASDEPRPPSNEERTGRSFRGQMMGSISHRLKREKVELDRWAEIQEKRNPAWNWGITLGTLRAPLLPYTRSRVVLRREG